MIQPRVKVVGLLIAILAFGAAVVPGVASAANSEIVLTANPLEVKPLLEESCQGGNVCIWTAKEYQGKRGEFRCVNEYHPNLGNHYSAKNRCPERPAFFLYNGAEVFCMNPGGNRPNPPVFNEFAVTNVGERC